MARRGTHVGLRFPDALVLSERPLQNKDTPHGLRLRPLEAHAILCAPDLDSAERAYLGLMPDLGMWMRWPAALGLRASPMRHAPTRCR